MKTMFSFLCGTVFGIYLEQNYDLPNVKNVVQDIKLVLQNYEKDKPKENPKKNN